MRRAARWLAAGSGAALLLALLWWTLDDDAPAARAAPPAQASAEPAAASKRAAAGLNAAAPAASQARHAAAFERWMTQHSSLRGVDLDGAWEAGLDGQLQATIALRRRFDQLLSLLGEATLDELRAFIAYDVENLAGPAAAQRVLDVWQRYVALQQHDFRHQPDMRDRRTWAAALAERQQVRRQLLGPEIAAAFFADDEQQLQALIQAQAPAQAVPVQAVDRARLAPDALARLKKEEAAWADWERRLADARRELAALNAQAQLSQLQRAEAMERFIAQRFDSGEATRVRALLQLPGAPAAGG
jgi:lipase chaperone LimK